MIIGICGKSGSGKSTVACSIKECYLDQAVHIEIDKIGHRVLTIDAGYITKNVQVKKLLLSHFFPEIDSKLYIDGTKELFKNVDVAVEGKVLKIGGKKC